MTDLIKRDDALLPCPFCRSPAIMQEETEDLWEVWCFECTALMQGFSTEAEAIAEWNTRAPPAIDPAAISEAALQARIEELVKERDYIEGTNDTLIALNQALEAKLTECEARLGKAVEDAEKWRYAFAAQSRKLQAVLYIEGVKAALAELGGKVMTDLNSHEESLATDLAKAAAKLTECEARLGKAVEALQWIKDHRGECFIPEPWDDMANNVLAELEGKE